MDLLWRGSYVLVLWGVFRKVLIWSAGVRALAVCVIVVLRVVLVRGAGVCALVPGSLKVLGVSAA